MEERGNRGKITRPSNHLICMYVALAKQSFGLFEVMQCNPHYHVTALVHIHMQTHIE